MSIKLSNLLNSHIEPKIGEISIVDGKRRMCVTPSISYGGGEGPQYVTQGMVHAITFKERKSSYVYALVESFCPLEKTVCIRITHGDTWGKFANNTRLVIKVSELSRCHPVDQCKQSLVEESRELEVKVRTQQAFYNLTIEELYDALKREYDAEMARFIGESEHIRLRSLLTTYVHLHKHVAKSGGWYAKQPNKISMSLRKQLLSQLQNLGGEA